MRRVSSSSRRGRESPEYSHWYSQRANVSERVQSIFPSSREHPRQLGVLAIVLRRLLPRRCRCRRRSLLLWLLEAGVRVVLRLWWRRGLSGSRGEGGKRVVGAEGGGLRNEWRGSLLLLLLIGELRFVLSALLLHVLLLGLLLSVLLLQRLLLGHVLKLLLLLLL
jgi:hypothetical protein